VALSRQDIARAGLRLLNEAGLNGLTLRLIADDLGVKAPALYWHLKNKQELLDEMATRMYADAAADREPAEPLDEWAHVAHRARALRRMMLAYRDGGKVFSGTYLGDVALVGAHPLQPSLDSGLDPRRAARALFTLYSFVIGFTIEEQAVFPTPGERDERYVDMPADDVFGVDPGAAFEDGLAITIAGIRQWLYAT